MFAGDYQLYRNEKTSHYEARPQLNSKKQTNK